MLTFAMAHPVVTLMGFLIILVFLDSLASNIIFGVKRKF